MPHSSQPNNLQSPTGKDKRSIRERIERKTWKLWKNIFRNNHGNLSRTYVFVAGMQRSGTNMLMEMLEWAKQTDVYHETDSRAFDNYEMRPRDVIHALSASSPAPFFIIKSLCELDQIKCLLDEFAPAKALWIVRTYEDTVNSAIRSFSNFPDQLHRLAQDKNAAGWRGRGMSDETQEILRRFDTSDLNEPSAAALMWYYRNILFFEQGLDHDPRVKCLFYEQLVSSPQVILRDIFDFLGIPDWSPWISRHVHARSIRKSPKTDVTPEIQTLCNALTQRFSSLNHL